MAEVNTTAAAPPLGDQGASDSEEEQTGSTQLSKDEMFHILQNERRRRVLEFISDCDGAVEMRDVAEQVAAWEHDTTVQALTSDERQRVYIALYQSHLPKLDDVGLIDYNQSRGIVDPKETVEQVEPYLFTAESESDDAPESSPAPGMETTSSFLDDGPIPFRAAVLCSTVLVAASWIGLTGTIGLSAPILATAITGLFTLSGLDAFTQS